MFDWVTITTLKTQEKAREAFNLPAELERNRRNGFTTENAD